MSKFHIILIRRNTALVTIVSVITLIIFSLILNSSFNNFVNSYTKIIVIDPGHGGIDGGTSKDGVLEKDINLDIAKRVKAFLEEKEYEVILTRNSDQSLEDLSDSSGSRHQRDLNARVNIINNSNAQLFLSIHGNCHTKNLDADGSIVLYNERMAQNKELAYFIQRALNNIMIDGKKRTVHDPRNNSSFYLLNCSKIPGIIIETGFISNQKERELLAQGSFQDEIAKAIAAGVEKYFSELKKVIR